MSLKFGSRAMKVENKPSVNKKIDYKMLCVQLQEEIDVKTDECSSLEIKLQNAYKNCPRCLENEAREKEEDKREEDDEEIDYKELYLKKEKENKEFLQRIDAIIAEQEQELNDLNQDNKEKAVKIQELQESLSEVKQEIKDKDSRIIEITDERGEEMSKINLIHEKEMEELK